MVNGGHRGVVAMRRIPLHVGATLAVARRDGTSRKASSLLRASPVGRFGRPQGSPLHAMAEASSRRVHRGGGARSSVLRRRRCVPPFGGSVSFYASNLSKNDPSVKTHHRVCRLSWRPASRSHHRGGIIAEVLSRGLGAVCVLRRRRCVPPFGGSVSL